MVVTKATSTNGSFLSYSGTYAEVIQALEDDNIQKSHIVGVALQGTTGSIVALVKQH